MELSDKARQARNAYQRAYRKKNPGRLRQYSLNYWERKADPTGAKVRQLHEQGFSQRAIAERLNIAVGTVNAILNKQ
jgi:DNA invertase Pin-like site-specific DNA recombinase